MQLVRPERYEEFLSALLTLVHRGITTQLSNTAGAGEQVGRRSVRLAGWLAGWLAAAAAFVGGWVVAFFWSSAGAGHALTGGMCGLLRLLAPAPCTPADGCGAGLPRRRQHRPHPPPWTAEEAGGHIQPALPGEAGERLLPLPRAAGCAARQRGLLAAAASASCNGLCCAAAWAAGCMAVWQYGCACCQLCQGCQPVSTRPKNRHSYEALAG